MVVVSFEPHRRLDVEPVELRGERTVLLPLEAGVAIVRGSEPRRSSEANAPPDAAFERRERRFSAACDGFDVHCAVRIAADDDQGRERLVRYCTRPAFALDRIELLPDGRKTTGPRREV
ncbi:hypothetical protein [Sorangium sp. So ce117]|uniref:hypothetical protein n=1 Tax=Sorangium sp. So ce117 TaxID=3133277 RepID=UPI003F5F3169